MPKVELASSVGLQQFDVQKDDWQKVDVENVHNAEA